MRKRALISLLLFAAIVATGSAIKYRPRTVPPSECSDVYRRYADVPGVDATFVKAYPVNDTLSVDVTLLQATDTAAWRQLIDDFRLTEAFKNAQIQSVDSTTSCLAVVTPQSYYQDTTVIKNFVGVASPLKRYICIFHCTDTQTWNRLYDAVYDKIYSLLYNNRLNFSL